jgi:hypothetical protein
MVRTVFGKAMWVGTATIFLMGMAMILAWFSGWPPRRSGRRGANHRAGVLTRVAPAFTALTVYVNCADRARVPSWGATKSLPVGLLTLVRT